MTIAGGEGTQDLGEPVEPNGSSPYSVRENIGDKAGVLFVLDEISDGSFWGADGQAVDNRDVVRAEGALPILHLGSVRLPPDLAEENVRLRLQIPDLIQVRGSWTANNSAVGPIAYALFRGSGGVKTQPHSPNIIVFSRRAPSIPVYPMRETLQMTRRREAPKLKPGDAPSRRLPGR
ncbi:hypothetical protein [Subtercola boreus]|uniref:hypothetical protein n=1 Tax=Subtercola boreus TaxID=120213 RepID=UPI00209C5670|nr:hypothetical protein [Subtercola boreus]